MSGDIRPLNSDIKPGSPEADLVFGCWKGGRKVRPARYTFSVDRDTGMVAMYDPESGATGTGASIGRALDHLRNRRDSGRAG